MRDYPNMSYCAFENTSRAMTQLCSMLETALEDGEPLNLNQYELPHYRAMFGKCQALMDLIEQHEEMIVFNGVQESADCDDSDDGEALASAGWGTDEDYGR